MNRFHFRRAARRLMMACAVAGGGVLLGNLPAVAQVTTDIPLPPEARASSPGDVDMRSGDYVPEITDISIGTPENGGIAIKRYLIGNPVPNGSPVVNKSGQFTTNWDYRLVKRGGASSGYTLTIESKALGKSYSTLYLSGPYYEQYKGYQGASRLERLASGSQYYFRYSSADGRVLTFSPTSDGTNAGASELRFPNGITYSFVYDNGGVNGDPRLRRVSSNTGYVAIYEYQAASGNERITKICLFNAASITPPTAQACPAAARKVTYTYNGSRLATIVDPELYTSSITSNYTNFQTPYQESFYKPGLAQPWLTNSYVPDNFTGTKLYVGSQSFAGGPTYSYYFDYHGDEWPKAAFWGDRWTVNGSATTWVKWDYYALNGHAPSVSSGPAKITDPLGRETRYSYGSTFAHLYQKTSPAGVVENYGYGLADTLSSIERVAVPGSSLASTTVSYTYDCSTLVNCNKPITSTDAKGAVANYAYHATHGGLLTETKPAPTAGAVRPQTRYTYGQFYAWYRNTSGVLTQAANPVWLVTQISECRTTASCSGTADELRTTFSYGSTGVANNLLPTSKTVALGNGSTSLATTFTYDSEGNKLTEDGPASGSSDLTRWRYDAMRRVVGVVSPDPDGAGALKHPAVRTTFDAAGRATKVEQGTVNSQSDTDWAGFAPSQAIDTTYDLLDRKTKEVVSAGSTTISVTQYSYDSFGRLECTAVRTDPVQWLNQTTACMPQTNGPTGPDRINSNVYDAAGQLVQVRKAVGTSLEQAYATYSYTADGQIEFTIDAKGNRSKFEYDGFGRQEKWLFPSTTLPASFNGTSQATALSTAGSANVSDYELYGYDANDNRTSLRKRDGQTIGFAYDALNRVTLKDIPGGTAQDVYYGYDLQNHQTYARFASTGGSGVTNAFDSLGRLTSSTLNMDSVSRTLSHLYDAHGNRTRLTFPDGVYYTMGYDALDRLNAGSWTSSGSTTSFLMIAYDNLGRRDLMTKSAVSTDYAYGSDLRLSSLTQNLAGTSGDVTHGFTHNAASQVIQETLSNNAYAYIGRVAVNRSYISNGLNQYASVAGNSFCYDANGNLTADGAYVYKYDVENRLIAKRTQVNTSCGSLNYTGTLLASLRYDPLGRLYETVGTATGTTRYLYDGDETVGEYASNGAMLRRFLWGDETDEPIVWNEGATLNCTNARFLQADRLGSVTSAADCSGNLVRIFRYDEYGIPQSGDGAALTPGNGARFLYTGQAWVPDLGMYYYKARMYSPTLGRFMQTDPIGYEDGLNWYGYVGDDPVNRKDPSGLAKDEIVVSHRKWAAPWQMLLRWAISIPPAGETPEQLAAFRKRQQTLYNERADTDEEKPYAGETPDEKPEDYERLGQKGKKSPPRRNKSDGSVWEEDKDAHGGSKWKRWPSVRDWEKNRGRQSIKPDGSVR